MTELISGQFFSLFRDENSLFWVLSNKYPDSVRSGPYFSYHDSISVMNDSNNFTNILISKGVISYD